MLQGALHDVMVIKGLNGDDHLWLSCLYSMTAEIVIDINARLDLESVVLLDH